MKRGLQFFALTVLWLGTSAPALAGNGVTIPEPTNMALLAIGLAGLIFGRRAGRRPPEE